MITVYHKTADKLNFEKLIEKDYILILNFNLYIYISLENLNACVYVIVFTQWKSHELKCHTQ